MSNTTPKDKKPCQKIKGVGNGTLNINDDHLKSGKFEFQDT